MEYSSIAVPSLHLTLSKAHPAFLLSSKLNIPNSGTVEVSVS